MARDPEVGQAVLACRSARATSPTTDNVPSVDLLEASVPETLRTPDVVDFGMSPFSWRRHSCLLGRDSSRPSSRAASTVPARRDESRRRRHECLRHVMAQVNFLNYPESSADIRSSEGPLAGGVPSGPGSENTAMIRRDLLQSRVTDLPQTGYAPARFACPTALAAWCYSNGVRNWNGRSLCLN